MADWLVRAVSPYMSPRGLELRGDVQGGDGNTLTGHYAVVNQWTTIDSPIEGRFLERCAPGCFLQTMAEDRAGMRVLLNHGYDSLGNVPIARIDVLREDSIGAYYEATLLDGVPDLIISGLRENQYGASFRFKVMRETWDYTPAKSAYNPDGIAERTIVQAQVAEFGPVTFPAYRGATAGLRSMTDWYYERQAV